MTFQIETRVRQVIRRMGPLAAFRQLMAESDAAIRQPELGNGRRLAGARTAIFTELVRHWVAEQRQSAGYQRPFAVVALGGTGRAEIAPYSDLDFAFLFDDTLEGNPFLLELQRQVLHTTTFEDRYGFGFQPLPFNFDDAPRLTGKQLNSFLDMRPVFDPDGLAAQFRDRIRATFDPFEHFLHVRGFWRDHLAQVAQECERVDRFNIKNEGLRVFLAGIWTLAGARFMHSHEVYPLLEDPRDLAAYDFLMRLRALVHARRGKVAASADGNHEQDVMGFDDFVTFDDLLPAGADERRRFEFETEVRARLLAARRRVAQFTKGVIERELKNGREVSPGSRVVYGVGGLFHRRRRRCERRRRRARRPCRFSWPPGVEFRSTRRNCRPPFGTRATGWCWCRRFRRCFTRPAGVWRSRSRFCRSSTAPRNGYFRVTPNSRPRATAGS